MKQSKSTLIIIIILLTIFAPITVYGTILRMQGDKDLEENVGNANKDFFLDNQLYFYHPVSQQLLGTYLCETDNCGNITPIIDDEKYGIRHFKPEVIQSFNVVGDQFAMFNDGNVKIYNYYLKQSVFHFEMVKNYGTSLQNNLIIANNNGKWGVLSLAAFSPVIPFEYDFIALAEQFDEENNLKTDKFIVLKNDEWFIIGIDAIAKTSGFNSPIISYNDNYFITANKQIFDFEENILKEDVLLNDVYIVDKYIILIDQEYGLNVFENLNNESIATYVIGEYEELVLKLNNQKLEIYKNKSLLTTLALP
ncbi:MAG: hypothetical protein E7172_03620 [Firmicutes bacterium]|nr:hypothetical protein [Bacillota bacterium]